MMIIKALCPSVDSARSEGERDEGFESIRGSWDHLRGRMRVFFNLFSFPFAIIFLFFSCISSLQSKGLVPNPSLHLFFPSYIYHSHYLYFLILILQNSSRSQKIGRQTDVLIRVQGTSFPLHKVTAFLLHFMLFN